MNAPRPGDIQPDAAERGKGHARSEAIWSGAPARPQAFSASANVSNGDPPTSEIAFNEPRYGINEVVSLH